MSLVMVPSLSDYVYDRPRLPNEETIYEGEAVSYEAGAELGAEQGGDPGGNQPQNAASS